MNVAAIIASHAPRAIALRHYIHKSPELSFNESNTAAVTQAALSEQGIDITKGDIAFTPGFYIDIGQGSKTLAIRADMDALPIQEDTGLTYSSLIPNIAHLCGHDVHTSWLTLTCLALNEIFTQQPQLAKKGKIRFVFQPAEEFGPPDTRQDNQSYRQYETSGAFVLNRAGVYKNVDSVIAGHVWPSLELGKLGITNRPDGFITAGGGYWGLNITGKGGHVALPELGHDLIANFAFPFMGKLYNHKLAQNPDWIFRITRTPTLGGTANAFANTFRAEGSLRSFTGQQHRQKVFEELFGWVDELTASTTMESGVYGVEDFPEGKVDSDINSLAGEVQTSMSGANSLTLIDHPELIGEDFGATLRERPGTFVLIGSADHSNDKTKLPLHSPQIIFPDQTIINGANYFTNFALQWLKA